MSSGFRLAQEIVALSEASSWPRAKLEWDLKEVYLQEEPDVCLCGHSPILEICVLRNKLNGQEAIVGNVCVKKFLGLPSDQIFQAVKRVRKDNTKSLNAAALAHAYEKGWINKWEYGFYVDIGKKRSLTETQSEKKQQINEKLLLKIVNARNNESQTNTD